MELLLLMIVIVLVFVLQSMLHRKERRELYNRLMARDLTEFNKVGQRKAAPLSEHNRGTRIKNPIREKFERNEAERKQRFNNGEDD